MSRPTRFDELSWHEKKISEEHKKIICSSIQSFQRGENSEGHNLRKFAEELEYREYLNTIDAFIAEENLHSDVLGAFMDKNEIARIEKHWLDAIFRKLRKLTNLEHAIVVLLSAEIIAAIYYKALKKATPSKLLREICIQILKDEEAHLSFQSFTLKKFYTKKNRPKQLLFKFYAKILMQITILVVWHSQKKVLLAGHYNFTNFSKECFRKFYRCHDMIDGRRLINMPKIKNVHYQTTT